MQPGWRHPIPMPLRISLRRVDVPLQADPPVALALIGAGQAGLGGAADHFRCGEHAHHHSERRHSEPQSACTVSDRRPPG